MNKSINYISITFGPITRTLALAESTKELWAASYLFSYLAKKYIEPFAIGERKRKFLIPLVTDERLWQPQYGAGLFPDRYIFESHDGDFIFLREWSKSILFDITEKISKEIKRNSKDEIFQFLHSFMKIYFFEKSYPENEQENKVVRECEDLMNLIEMQDSFPVSESRNYLQSLFRNVNGNPIIDANGIITGFEGSFLIKDAYGEEVINSRRLFESIIEISARNLIDNKIIEDDYSRYITSAYQLRKLTDLSDPEEENSVFQEEFKKAEKYFLDIEAKIKKELLPYQKNIAIVKADGDNIGKTIKQLSKLMPLNKAFVDFNIRVTELLRDYKAQIVFVGGDDLLFFAPVSYGDKIIFELLGEIDEEFNQCMRKMLSEEVDDLPTISLGLSISYYKYPMFEALQTTSDLLENDAKEGSFKDILLKYTSDQKVLDKLIKKNKLAFSIQKHSGQVLSATLQKGTLSYERFSEIVKKYSRPELYKHEGRKRTENFLSSVMHKLEFFTPMIKIIMNNINEEKNENEERNIDLLINLFKNNFDEKIHEQYTGLFEDISQLIYLYYNETMEVLQERMTELKDFDISNNDKEKIFFLPEQETVNMVYVILRFIHFINSDRDE